MEDISKFEVEFKTGLFFYLFLSLLRGFIFVGTSFLNSMFTTSQVALFGIIPLLFIGIPDKIDKLWNNSLAFSVLLWFISMLIPNLLIRTVVITVGMGLCYGGLRRQLTQSEFKQPIYVVVTTVFYDLFFRSPNNGADPLVGASVTQIIFGALLVIIVLLSRSPVKITERIVRNDIPTIASVVGIYFVGFSYFMYFANPGVLTLLFNYPAQLSNLIFVMSTGILILLLDYVFQKFTPRIISLSPLFIIMMAVGIFTYPWYNFSVVFAILGYFSALVILALLFRQILRETTIGTLTYSLVFVLSFLTMLGVGLQILTSDDVKWHYIIMSIGVICSILGVLPQIKEEST